MAPAVTFPYDLAETLYGTFAGGLTKLSEREVWLDDKMTNHASHRIYCPSATVIANSDTLKLGTRTFVVKWYDNIEIKTGHHKEILVDEVI
jgi:hypothetical protein